MFFVYILASKAYGTLYVGMTTELLRRIWEHKSKAVPGFTKKYARIAWYGSKRTKIEARRFNVRSRSRNGNATGKSS